MPPKEKRGAAQKPQEQLPHIAFTTYGFALEDGRHEKREHFEEITAYSEGGDLKIAKVMDKPGFARESMELTVRERAPPSEAGTRRYGIVGYALPAVLAEKSTKYKQRNDSKREDGSAPKKQVGTGMLKPDNTFKWDDTKVMYVVTPILTDARTSKVMLYALHTPENGLCRAERLGQDLVFYRSEFRDSTSASKDRGGSWNKNVSHHFWRVKDDNVDTLPPRKVVTFQRGRAPGRVVVEPWESVFNHIRSLVELFERKREPFYLEEMKRALERSNADFEHRPPPEFNALLAFCDPKAAIDNDDYDAVVVEAEKLWGRIQDLTPARAEVLKSCLKEAHALVPFAHLYGVLSQGAFKLAREEQLSSDKEKAIFGRELLDTVDRCICPGVKPTLYLGEEDQDVGLLRAVLAKLREVIEGFDKWYDEAKDTFGDAVMEGRDVLDIWEKYKVTPDTDSARLVINETVRYINAAGRHDMHGNYMAALRELVVMLEECLESA